jgi:hypothetical protein
MSDDPRGCARGVSLRSLRFVIWRCRLAGRAPARSSSTTTRISLPSDHLAALLVAQIRRRGSLVTRRVPGRGRFGVTHPPVSPGTVRRETVRRTPSQSPSPGADLTCRPAVPARSVRSSTAAANTHARGDDVRGDPFLGRFVPVDVISLDALPDRAVANRPRGSPPRRSCSARRRGHAANGGGPAGRPSRPAAGMRLI